ncbi:uncharacterized protein TNCV_1033151 [Trichonephila clavipes]|nr:uncharacterized protein TNCV_1033151 [Trichonephila clavipes]
MSPTGKGETKQGTSELDRIRLDRKRGRRASAKQTQAIEWHRHLREGGESVEDGKHSGRPQTSCTAENNEKVSMALVSSFSRMLKEDQSIDEIYTLSRTQAFKWHRRFGESVEDDKRSGRPDFHNRRKHRKGFCGGTVGQHIVPRMLLVKEEQSADEVKNASQELWFQQDGATCHTARATIDLLKDTLGDRLISRFGPVNWPPRSCDLTPLDYFLWGYVKSLVYADKPQTLDYLEDNIYRVIADIRPQMLEKVIENWTSKWDYIRAGRGSPMPEIIFKM